MRDLNFAKPTLRKNLQVLILFGTYKFHYLCSTLVYICIVYILNNHYYESVRTKFLQCLYFSVKVQNFLSDFDRASSLMCGNKMPTRCNRCFFIADLIACSTCFRHHYAHRQELESIIPLYLYISDIG